jgi:uncharacterized membrane protein
LFLHVGMEKHRGIRMGGYWIDILAVGYLGWFVSPWILFASTAAVVIVTWRRQFASNAWQAMGS